MGSFPNTTAARILNALFGGATAGAAVPGSVSAAPNIYGNANTVATGIDGGVASGAVTLYVGLIAGGNATNQIPNNTGSATLATILTDNAILGGTTAAPINTAAGGPGAVYTLDEYTVSANNMARKQIAFTLSNATDVGGSSAQPVAQIQGPSDSAGVQFASSGTGATGSQAANRSVIGFFISTRLTAAAGGSAPNVIAYGNLSNSRTINAGDNPTFAQNAITITLD